MEPEGSQLCSHKGLPLISVCNGNSSHSHNPSLHVEITNEDNAHHFFWYQG